jgi:hypothetical protein
MAVHKHPSRWLLWGVALLPALTLARPDLSREVGVTLAESGSAHYRFERFTLDSRDGQRHYRIDLAIPRREAPVTGYPVLYMLDGNAALAALREDWLAELDRHGPPLLVMIGYASKHYFEPLARTYDYTPAPASAAPLFDDAERQRPAGGAPVFRELIERRIKPQVEARVRVDRGRQGLWGHSYGGLFVLDTLFHHPQAFQSYVAASPSLWWQSGLLLQGERLLAADARARLLILRGGREARPRQPGELPVERARAMAAVPADAPRQLAERLAAHAGLRVEYREVSGLEHGPMLPASILPALRLMTEEILP